MNSFKFQQLIKGLTNYIIYNFISFQQLMLKILGAILSNKSLLTPKYVLKDVTQIFNIKQLMADNKKIYIFDKDDTIVPLHQFQIKNQKISNFFEQLAQKGKVIYILSNSVRVSNKKVSYLNNNGQTRNLTILHTTKKKPYNGEELLGLIQKEYLQNTSGKKLINQNIVFIGDRLLTDILLGNLMGCTTVLVQPIEKSTVQKHGMGVYIMRKIQKLI